MQTAYKSPSRTRTSDTTCYIALDRKDGEVWQQYLSGMQDRSINSGSGNVPLLLKLDIGVWEFAPGVRLLDMPAFLQAQSLLGYVQRGWKAESYTLTGQVSSAGDVTHDGYRVSAYEDLIEYREAINRNMYPNAVDKQEWRDAILKRDAFRQQNKIIFDIYHHCYTLHILLTGLKQTCDKLKEKREEERWLHNNAMWQYAKHPVSIVYFIAGAAGVAVGGYYWWGMAASDSSITFDMQVAGTAIFIFCLTMVTLVLGGGLYYGVVGFVIGEQRRALNDEITQLRNGTGMAKNAITEMTRLESIVKINMGGPDLHMQYSQISPLYTVMVSTVAEASGHLREDGALIMPNNDTSEFTTASREMLESIAEVIYKKMQDADCGLPGGTA